MDKLERIFDRLKRGFINKDKAKLELIQLIASEYSDIEMMADVYLAHKRGDQGES